MRTRTRLALATVALALCGAATAKDAAPAATAQAASSHTPLLWKVSDGDNSLYLLGSIHLLKPDDYPLSPDIDVAFEDAEHVLFELDMSSMTTPDNLATMQRAMLANDGKALSARLSPQARTQLETLLKASGGSLAQVDTLDPWALNLTMAMGIMQSMGFKADAGVDLHIDTRARAAGKRLGALETIDDQFHALDSAPMTEQVASLERFLAEPGKTVEQVERLHRAWRTGDTHTLDRILRADFEAETPESYRLVNVARNQRWLPQLEARLREHAEDDTLAVMGAMHLMGADGVVEKLRAKGYTVERVCSACATGARSAD